jgi:PBP1b-binding outer membrane lipoprotein LpoB
MKKVSKLSLLFLAVLLVTACTRNIARNDNGSLSVETTITQQQLQEVITSSIADPLVKNVTVSLQSGYVLVSGERQRLNDSSKTDSLTFRLDLSASNGKLNAAVSNAQVDGVSIEQNRVDNWNQTIANRLSNIGRKSGNATLQTLSITPASVTMTWNVTKQ